MISNKMNAKSSVSNHHWSLRGTVVALAWCVLILIAIRADVKLLRFLLLLTAGPVCGAVIQRWRGGLEAFGGLVGGVVSSLGYALWCYLRAYHSPEGFTTQLVGPIELVLVMTICWALVGMVVGFLVSAVIRK